MNEYHARSYNIEKRRREERKDAFYISTLFSIALLSVACYSGCHNNLNANHTSLSNTNSIERLVK